MAEPASIRLAVVVCRNGMPEVKTIWALSLARNPTIANLLEEVNEIFPLESGEWGLEDYKVELLGPEGKGFFFECLHFQAARTVLSQGDTVYIRPLLTDDLRRRRLTGRHQISSDGKHLIDGVAFGRPLLKAPKGRPSLSIPPRKRRRVTDEDEEEEEEEEEEDQSWQPLLLTNGEEQEGGRRSKKRKLSVSFSKVDGDDSEIGPDYEPEEGSTEDLESDSEQEGGGDDLDDVGSISDMEDEAGDLQKELEDLRKEAGGQQSVNSDARDDKTTNSPTGGVSLPWAQSGQPLSNLEALRAAFPSAPNAVCETVFDSHGQDLRQAYLALLPAFDPAMSETATLAWPSKGKSKERCRNPAQRGPGPSESSKKANGASTSATHEFEDGDESGAGLEPEEDAHTVSDYVKQFDRRGLPPGTISTGKLSNGLKKTLDQSTTLPESGASDVGVRKNKTPTSDVDSETSSSGSSSSSSDSGSFDEDSDQEDGSDDDVIVPRRRSKKATAIVDSDSDSDSDSGPEVQTVTKPHPTKNHKPSSSTAKEKTKPVSPVHNKSNGVAENSDSDDDTSSSSSSSSSDSDSSDLDSDSGSDSSSESEKESEVTSRPPTAATSQATSQKPSPLQEEVVGNGNANPHAAQNQTHEQSTVAPGEGKKATKKRNIRRKLQKKGVKEAADRDARGEISGPPEITAAEGLEARRKALLAQIASEDEETGPVEIAESSTMSNGVNGKRKHSDNGGIEPDGESSRETPRGVQTQGNEETPSTRKRRIDLSAGRRMLFGALGLKNPKTKEDENKLRDRLTKAAPRPLPNTRLEEGKNREMTSAQTGPEIADEDPDAWRSIIKYSAVECCHDGVKLSEPPFPFVQRWDPQQQGSWYSKKNKRGGRGKREKRNQSSCYQEAAYLQADYTEHQDGYDETYNETYKEGVEQSTGGVQVHLNYDDEPESESLFVDDNRKSHLTTHQETDDEDLPALPDDLTTLSPLLPGRASLGMVITWKQFVISGATNWQPQVINLTGVVVRIDDDATGLQVLLAKRDRNIDRTEKRYDQKTGQRIYDRFEAPDDDDDDDDDDGGGALRTEEEEIEAQGYRTLGFVDMIEPRIVQQPYSGDDEDKVGDQVVNPLPSVETDPVEHLVDVTTVAAADLSAANLGCEEEVSMQQGMDSTDFDVEIDLAPDTTLHDMTNTTDNEVGEEEEEEEEEEEASHAAGEEGKVQGIADPTDPASFESSLTSSPSRQLLDETSLQLETREEQDAIESAAVEFGDGNVEMGNDRVSPGDESHFVKDTAPEHGAENEDHDRTLTIEPAAFASADIMAGTPKVTIPRVVEEMPASDNEQQASFSAELDTVEADGNGAVLGETTDLQMGGMDAEPNVEREKSANPFLSETDAPPADEAPDITHRKATHSDVPVQSVSKPPSGKTSHNSLNSTTSSPSHSPQSTTSSLKSLTQVFSQASTATATKNDTTTIAQASHLKPADPLRRTASQKKDDEFHKAMRKLDGFSDDDQDIEADKEPFTAATTTASPVLGSKPMETEDFIPLVDDDDAATEDALPSSRPRPRTVSAAISPPPLFRETSNSNISNQNKDNPFKCEVTSPRTQTPTFTTATQQKGNNNNKKPRSRPLRTSSLEIPPGSPIIFISDDDDEPSPLPQERYHDDHLDDTYSPNPLPRGSGWGAKNRKGGVGAPSSSAPVGGMRNRGASVGGGGG